MEGLLAFGLIVMVIGLFDAVAIGLGVDSRDGSSDPRQPIRPVGLSV